MNTTALRTGAHLALPTSTTALRALLVLGCCAGLAAAAAFGQPVPAADPELARLLRGMALFKGTMVLAAIAVLWWRFALPVAPRVAAVYLVGAWHDGRAGLATRWARPADPR
jgi:hypothetical protein